MFSYKSCLKGKLLLAFLWLSATLLAADLKMATTTSTDNTGLLDVLGPLYKQESGVDLKWVAVGTGNALKLGENCDVDVVLVHAPKAEREYVAKGFAINRKPVMYNDFVIVGDPAFKGKFQGKSVRDLFKIVEKEKIKFISRGDKSGTHTKEKEVWMEAFGRVPEKESWYIEAGQGMLATINIAQEQRGLTLTDRGTFIKYEESYKGNPPLVILFEGDTSLKNFYSIMAVNPERCKNADIKGANALIDWITSAPIQKRIADFKLLDKQLFTPDAQNRKE